MKILFVDDSSTTRAVYKALLEKNGYEVLTAGSMAEALTLARAEHPPLAIVDYYMPDGNGNELTAALLADPETRDILVVMHSQRDVVQESLVAGAIDLIYKEDPQDVFLLRVAAMSRYVETQSRQREVELVRREKTFVESVLAAVPTALLVIRDGEIVTTNHMYREMFGVEVVGRQAIDALTAWKCPGEIIAAIRRGDSFTGRECQWRGGPDPGDRRYVSLSQTVISPANNERLLAIGDITERKRAEERLVSLAQYDTLTGLANRSFFHTRMKEAIANARRSGRLLGLLLFDLDHFKDINDTLGHFVGDLLLKEVAGRLTACTRKTDTVARLGGDEFAIIATNLREPDNAAVLASKLIATLVDPFHLEGQEVVTATSVGITLFPIDGSEPDQLLKNADMALYQVKNDSRGTYQFYAAEMHARAQARKRLETGLRHALERDEFELVYQPIIAAAGNEVVGAEALLRWEHPDRGLISPDQFIGIAESTGLIVPLGDWVLRTACAQCVAWHEAGLAPITIAVNLSAIQFKRTELVTTVREVIEETGIDPACLVLEITESVLMDEIVSVTDMLQRLHDIGVKLAIDDFGSGYSSLSYLKRFPVDKLKIDRTFMEQVTKNADDAAIVRAIITLGKTLNLRVVAEGVESEAQLAFLRQAKCDEIQGFYFSRGLDNDAFVAWYRRFQNHSGYPRIRVVSDSSD